VQIHTASKVFISNAGVDGVGYSTVNRAGDTNQPYNQFYAALKSWGRFEMVGTPSDADLVLEIRFSAPLSGTRTIDTYSPLLALTILDGKTHFILWTITEPVESANLAKTWRKNLDQGITELVADLKALVTQPAASASGQQ
jgi:hypothetical protein